jgi:hypothetical protein
MQLYQPQKYLQNPFECQCLILRNLVIFIPLAPLKVHDFIFLNKFKHTENALVQIIILIQTVSGDINPPHYLVFKTIFFLL